jgi:microtubule-associated protein-like 1/2
MDRDEDEGGRDKYHRVVSPRFHTTAVGGLRAAVGVLAYSPDGTFLAAGDQLGGLEMYGVARRELRGRARCLGHASAGPGCRV